MKCPAQIPTVSAETITLSTVHKMAEIEHKADGGHTVSCVCGEVDKVTAEVASCTTQHPESIVTKISE